MRFWTRLYAVYGMYGYQFIVLNDVMSWADLTAWGCDDMELLISPLGDPRGGGGGRGKRGMGPWQMGIYPSYMYYF